MSNRKRITDYFSRPDQAQTSASNASNIQEDDTISLAEEVFPESDDEYDAVLLEEGNQTLEENPITLEVKKFSVLKQNSDPVTNKNMAKKGSHLKLQKCLITN